MNSQGHEKRMVESFDRILKAITTKQYIGGEDIPGYFRVAAAVLTLAATIDQGVLVWKGEV